MRKKWNIQHEFIGFDAIFERVIHYQKVAFVYTTQFISFLFSPNFLEIITEAYGGNVIKYHCFIYSFIKKYETLFNQFFPLIIFLIYILPLFFNFDYTFDGQSA